MRQIDDLPEVRLTGRRHGAHHLILWCRHGRLVVACPGRPAVDLTEGEAVLVPAGLEHSVDLAHGGVAHVVLLVADESVGPDPLRLRVGDDLAPVLLGLVVAGGSELRPASSGLSTLGRTLLRAFIGQTWSAHAGVTAFIPWVTNPAGTRVLVLSVLGDSTVVLRRRDGTEQGVELPRHMGVSIPPGLPHRVVTHPGGVCLPIFHEDPAAGPDEVGLHHLPAELRRLAARQYMASTTALRPHGWDDTWLGRALAECSQRTVVARGDEAPSILDRLRESVLRDPGARLDVLAWAREAGCSRRTLERDFRREVGDSLLSWRNTVRSAHAAGLLEDGHQAKWVARRLGFTHASAFTRAFREIHGVTPRDYRTRSRAS